MDDNHALVINKNGIESYKKYQPRYSFGYGDIVNDCFDDSLLMECPYCFETTHYSWIKLNNKCQHCRQYISEEDVYV